MQNNGYMGAMLDMSGIPTTAYIKFANNLCHLGVVQDPESRQGFGLAAINSTALPYVSNYAFASETTMPSNMMQPPMLMPPKTENHLTQLTAVNGSSSSGNMLSLRNNAEQQLQQNWMNQPKASQWSRLPPMPLPPPGMPSLPPMQRQPSLPPSLSHLSGGRHPVPQPMQLSFAQPPQSFWQQQQQQQPQPQPSASQQTLPVASPLGYNWIPCAHPPVAIYWKETLPPTAKGSPKWKSLESQNFKKIKMSREMSTQTVVSPQKPSTEANPTDGGSLSNNHALGQGQPRDSEDVLSAQRMKEIMVRMLQGCNIAEQLAGQHSQIPCFKKIDMLCARIKYDLLRSDSVMANINSQGVAWAIKDFIFVYIRLVNAWIILRGYMYNTPEGLHKIKNELPSGIVTAFDQWQLSTHTLIGLITQSFVNLDIMLKEQKSNNSDVTNRQSEGSCDSISSSFSDSRDSSSSTDITLAPNSTRHCTVDNPTLEDWKRIYTMVRNSEEIQRCVNFNGTYLKSGMYNPLKSNGNLKYPTKAGEEQLRGQPVQMLPHIISIYDVSQHLMQLINTEFFFTKQFIFNYFPKFYERYQHNFIDVRTIIIKCEKSMYQYVHQIVHDLRRISYFALKDMQDHYNPALLTQTALYQHSINQMLSEPPYHTHKFNHIVGEPGEMLFSPN